MKGFQQYTYVGPVSGVTLVIDGKAHDVMLNPKRAVMLPPDHEYTQSMVAQKRLIPAAPPVAPAPQKPAAGSKEK